VLHLSGVFKSLPPPGTLPYWDSPHSRTSFVGGRVPLTEVETNHETGTHTDRAGPGPGPTLRGSVTTSSPPSKWGLHVFRGNSPCTSLRARDPVSSPSPGDGPRSPACACASSKVLYDRLPGRPVVSTAERHPAASDSTSGTSSPHQNARSGRSLRLATGRSTTAGSWTPPSRGAPARVFLVVVFRRCRRRST